MRISEASFVIEDKLDGKQLLKNLERYGRTCYKSEAKITTDSAYQFIAKLIQLGHESVLEHEKITVRFICDRALSHEIVRHRLGSYSQESTRYCNYKKRGLEFIKPPFPEDGEGFRIWLSAMQACEQAYNALIEAGATPEEARGVLPHYLKTEVVVTYNLREWRHFFKLRCSKPAHPQMRKLACALLKEFQRQIPVVFDDIQASL